MRSGEGMYLQLFQAECFVATVNRMNSDPLSCPNSFMETIQKNLPHWTQSKPDQIVYTKVVEASLASKCDIEKYLVKLEEELKIGQPNFPKQVVIAGDQQTFVIMWNLKKTY